MNNNLISILQLLTVDHGPSFMGLEVALTKTQKSQRDKG